MVAKLDSGYNTLLISYRKVLLSGAATEMDDRGKTYNVTLNDSNITNGSFCFEFSASQVQTVITTETILSSVAAVLCFMATLLIIFSKQHKRFVYRLVLYLMVAALFKSLLTIFQSVALYHSGKDVAVRNGLNGLCTALGFLNQTLVWAEKLIICWIILYLMVLLVLKQSVGAIKWQHEVCGLGIVVFIPLLVNWIPFVKNMYGLSGLWCWIKLTNGSCKEYTLGLVYMLVLFYGPILLVIIFSFSSFIAIVIALCRKQKMGSQVYKRALKEAVPLVAYPFIYNIIYCVFIVSRVYYLVETSNGSKPLYPLWLAHALAGRAGALLPPLAFLLHPNTLKRLFRRKRDLDSTPTTFPVSKEWSTSEEDPLVIKGSTMRDKALESNNILEGKFNI